MAFQPQAPFPKSRGDMVRSTDWNDLVSEVQRLDNDKVNRAGDKVGSLTINGTLGVGTAADDNLQLQVQSSGATRSSLAVLSTPNNEDFLEHVQRQAQQPAGAGLLEARRSAHGHGSRAGWVKLQGTAARQQLGQRRGACRDGRPHAGRTAAGGAVACQSNHVRFFWRKYAGSDAGGQLCAAAGRQAAIPARPISTRQRRCVCGSAMPIG